MYEIWNMKVENRLWIFWFHKFTDPYIHDFVAQKKNETVVIELQVHQNNGHVMYTEFWMQMIALLINLKWLIV